MVEDDEAMREAISARLESWGHRVTGVSDAETARERIRAVPPDMVLADVVLPDASGLDLLEWTTEESDLLPFVLMTAHAEVDLAVQAMKQGAVDFLTKPVDGEDLLAAIEESLGSL